MKLPIILCVLLVSITAFAEIQHQEIKAEQLGKLEQKTEVINLVRSYAGSELVATVSEINGQAFVLDAPMNVQRVVYLKAPGDKIQAGEPFVTLFGPEVHHYYSQYLISKRLFEQARLLFENSQKLFKNKSLSESEWLKVSQDFYVLRLEYDEYTHFFEYLHAVDERQDALTIAAPTSGVLAYEHNDIIRMNDHLARFIPSDAIRLKINVPASMAGTLSSVQLANCSLNIEQMGKQVERFYTTAWSQTFPATCAIKASIGELHSVTPHYQLDAFSVPSSSVFVLDGENYVLRKKSDTYIAAKVSLLSGEKNRYIVLSDDLSMGDEVLVSSVSAAQGIMMGLGE